MASTRSILDIFISVPELAAAQRVIEPPEPIGRTGDGNRRGSLST